MNLITNVTTDPLQTQQVILPDGTQFKMTLSFKPLQYGWFIQELTYGTLVIRGIRVCISPNLLYQFKNIIPFGIACFSLGNREPSLQQDFSSGAANLFLLSAAEVAQFSEFLSGA